MKKILLNAYTEFPSPHQGGPNKVIYEIIKTLDRTKFSAHYLSKHLYDRAEYTDNFENSAREKLSFKKKSVLNHLSDSDLFKKIVANPFYLKYHFNKTNKYFNRCDLSKTGYDVLHSHDVKSFYFLHAKLKWKKILTIHTKGPLIDDLTDYFGTPESLKKIYKRFQEIEQKALNEADIITFPSHASMELFNKKNLNKEKCRVVYNGIDAKDVEKIKSSISFEKIFNSKITEPFKLINVADHIEPKNIEMLLYTVQKINSLTGKTVQFINIGAGPLTGKLISLVNELRIDNFVKFIGKIPHQDVITLLKEADYMLHPSERVIFDYIILEALACGTTIIANSNGGNKEIITHNINGYLIDDINSEKLFQQVINSSKIKNTILKESVEKFSNEQMVNGYQQLYS